MLEWHRHPNARGILSCNDEIDFTYLILDRPMRIGNHKYPQIFVDLTSPKQVPIGTKFVAFGARSGSLWTREVLSKEPMNENGDRPIQVNYLLRTTAATHSGESGSPLFAIKESVPFIVGVTHGGRKPNTPTGEDRPEYYNTYTYLASAAPWLEKKIGFKTDASIAQNYKNLICKMSEVWSSITLKSLLLEYLEYESNPITCNGQSLEKLIANREQLDQQAAELEKILAQQNAVRTQEIDQLKQNGLLSEYGYQRAFDAGVNHLQAIEVAKADKEDSLSSYEYVRARTAGANHSQAFQLALNERKNIISVYEYAKLKAANIDHDVAVEVAQMDRSNTVSSSDYIRFRSGGLSHEEAK